MSSYHLTTFFKRLTNKSKLISLELCPNSKINISEVIALAPPFCSVTWLDNKVANFNEHPAILLSRQLLENNINVVIHLPGRIHEQKEVLEILTIIKNKGIRNILAVQGERSLGESKNDFLIAKDLVKFIREHFDDYFCIGVTGYPSGHPKCENLKQDLIYLKQKVDAGADFIVTQAIFDINTLCSFYKNCRDLAIEIPILPAMFVINSYSSLMKMVKLCKLRVPDNTMKFIHENKDNEEVLKEYGISSVLDIMQHVFNSDDIEVNCLHIFTLNDLENVTKVMNKLKSAT